MKLKALIPLKHKGKSYEAGDDINIQYLTPQNGLHE